MRALGGEKKRTGRRGRETAPRARDGARGGEESTRQEREAARVGAWACACVRVRVRAYVCGGEGAAAGPGEGGEGRSREKRTAPRVRERAPRRTRPPKRLGVCVVGWGEVGTTSNSIKWRCSKLESMSGFF